MPMAEDQHHEHTRAPAHRVQSSSASQHLSLRFTPVVTARQRADIRILPQGRQVPVLEFRVPQRRPFGQLKFRSAASCLLLFAREPISQGRHQIVVRQLVEPSIGLPQKLARRLPLRPPRVRWV